MATISAIEWTDRTWNPLAGCTRASAGCDNCYAAVMAYRLEQMAKKDIAEGKDPGGKAKYIGVAQRNAHGKTHFNGTINVDEAALDQPLNWSKPARIFVNSMSDLFHPSVPPAFVWRVFRTMMDAHWHTFQVLTKRPENIMPLLKLYGITHVSAWPANVWIGTSVEDQAAADQRIPHLLEVPAKVRFLSCEPLIGPVNLRSIPIDRITRADVVTGAWIYTGAISGAFRTSAARIQWVIAGGESGPNARPMHPDWARSLRDQCHSSGVPFFFKQWGAYWPVGTRIVEGRDMVFMGNEPMYRVGKHDAGRELDGQTWGQFPEVVAH